MFIAPIFSLGVAVSVLARVPRLIKVIPVALVGEGLSLILAIKDTFAANRNKHTVWKRYAN
jgi:hypothetical protein